MKRDGVYIIDKLANIGQYLGLHPNLDRAIAIVQRGGFEAYKPGRNEIDGETIWANCDTPTLVRPADRRPELHHRYFDIQIPLVDETYGVGVYDPKAPGSFDETRDVGFYEQKLEWFDLKPGDFAIFYPKTCVHAPSCTRGEPHVARKIIFKVKA